MSPDPEMDPDVPNQFRSGSQSKQAFFLLLCLAVAVVVIAWIASPRRLRFADGVADSGPVLWLPELTALGWINGPSPKPRDLVGKVVVIEVWASWCGPCRQKMPHLVRLHETFAPRGVVFVGLTNEEQEDLDEIQKMIDSFGVTWPNGWGATPTIQALEADMLPMLYIFGADGRMVWFSPSGGDVNRVLESELKKLEAKSNAKPT